MALSPHGLHQEQQRDQMQAGDAWFRDQERSNSVFAPKSAPLPGAERPKPLTDAQRKMRDELIIAQLAAREELLDRLRAARSDGEAWEMLSPSSPKYILPDIVGI
jgi:hypothetical protein